MNKDGVTDAIIEAGAMVELVRLFPEAHDTLTRQEMRDAKGNWRSLIDQQTKALSKLRVVAISLKAKLDASATEIIQEEGVDEDR